MTKADVSSTRQPEPKKVAKIRLQTVQVGLFEYDPRGSTALSIGEHINNMIDDAVNLGRLPNKLIVELNPPTPPADEQMD